jgi:Ca-activated chloride channel family protein
MRFLQPDAGNWLLLVPLVVCAWYLHVYAKRRFRRRAAFDRHLEPVSRFSTWRRDAVALLAAVAAVALIVAAMARPQVLLQRNLPEYEREDLIFVLDRSVSMLARDVQPTRFRRALAEIRAFLLNKPDSVDRVALVGFAGTSIVLSPLTRDINNLLFYLEWIAEDTDLRFGTDIGAALATARELARKDPRPTRKVYMVVSDGDDQGEELGRQLMALRAERAHVYTIGIGSDRDVEIPIVDEGGNPLAYGDDLQPITTRFSEVTLRNIATMTGGRFIRSVSGSEVAPALRQAVERERRVVAWTSSVEYRDLYRECLAGAGLAILVLLLAL